MDYGYFNLPKNRKIFDILGEELDWASLRRVLDVGCGPGYLSRFMADRPEGEFFVVGVERALETARRAASLSGDRLSFIQGDIVRLPFPSNAFDAVVCNSVIEHLPRKLRRPALLELRRVLKPGGKALVCVPTSLHKFWMLHHINFHDKNVYGLKLRKQDFLSPRALARNFPELLKLPYLFAYDAADHLPGRWRRLMDSVPGMSVTARAINLFSNRRPFLSWFAALERRTARRAGWWRLGTSILFVLTKEEEEAAKQAPEARNGRS